MTESIDRLEDLVRRRGTTPTVKEQLTGDHNFYYSEGYSSPPHLRWQKVGDLKMVAPEDFPSGMYAVLYAFDTGNKNQKLVSVNFYPASTSQKHRIEDTKGRALTDLTRLLNARKERGGIAN